MNKPEELGVGLVYFQGFEDFLALHSSLIDVVEIEPQTFWYDKDDECNAFKYNQEVMNFLCAYKRRKLFHGVGFPIGGTYLPPAAHFNTLRRQAAELTPQWVSEHLSFDFFKENGRDVNAGFLLPPLQSAEGVKIAAANIRHYREQMDCPFAFETGVNYLQPCRNEIPDGMFVNKIAEEADCYILLDLHNILTNQRNGRQSVKDFLNSLNLERVIELHIANGVNYKDFYLDAHSGASDAELLEILEDLVVKLPNLKALMFEINSDYFRKVPEEEIVGQLETMHRIWDKRGRNYKKLSEPIACDEGPYHSNISVAEWEITVGKLVLGRELDSALSHELQQDKGIAIIKDLVFNFRGSLLVSMFKLTTRLLRLNVGEAAFYQYVNEFFDNNFPELLPVVLAGQFSDYIYSKNINCAYLEKMLEYELALIHTAIDKQDRSVTFLFDPMPVIDDLEEARLPAIQTGNNAIELRIVPEKPTVANEFPVFTPVMHN